MSHTQTSIQNTDSAASHRGNVTERNSLRRSHRHRATSVETSTRQFQKLGEDRTSFTRETSRTVGPTYATRNHTRPAHVVDKLTQAPTILPSRLKRRRQSLLRRQRRQSPIRRQRRRSPLKMTAMSLYVVLNILSRSRRSRRSRRVCWRRRCRFT